MKNIIIMNLGLIVKFQVKKLSKTLHRSLPNFLEVTLYIATPKLRTVGHTLFIP